MDNHEQQRIFDEWLAQHRGLFFKVVHAYAFTPHDREDLFQEVATQVWESVPGFRGESKVTTWIYRVALYTAMSWSKKEKRYRDRHRAMSDGEQILLQDDAHGNPQLDWLYEQIGQLDKVDRSLTVLMLDGYKYKEIAETLGITESHVGVKLNRIKKKLTENLKNRSNES